MHIKTKELIFTAMFAALTGIGAYIKIEIPYVPITMQFFFCALSGILLGPRLGMMSQLIYIAVGLSGVPVFTHGGGLTYIFQPSFGYLVGFVISAFVIGKTQKALKKNDKVHIFYAVLSGLLIVYLCGVIHLHIILNYYIKSPKTLSDVLQIGFVPFIAGDLISSAVVSVTASKLLPVIKRLGLV